MPGEFALHDAWHRFGLKRTLEPVTGDCRSGDVLQGKLKPDACPHFGGACTPEHPLGAPMVSSEGACAAHYAYGRLRERRARETS